MNKSVATFLLSCLPLGLFAQQVALDNNLVKREFDLSGQNGFSTVSYHLKDCKDNFVQNKNKEFSFRINDKEYTGLSPWEVTYRDTTEQNGGKGLVFDLKSKETDGLSLRIVYMAFPGVPVVKKQMTFFNNGKKNMKLEALDSENLKIGWRETETWVMRYYGRYKHVGAYVGDWDDPVITVHDLDGDKGMAIGNEAPGVIKRSTALVDGKSVTAGLRYPDQSYGFRKWIDVGEQWESPAVFTALYAGTPDPYEVLNTAVSDYTRKYMGTRFETLDKKPMFVYNTWFPFYTKINHDLLTELADAAAECGVEEFIVDDGWQICHGDWEVNKEKFPNGLKPLFDHIKSMGMKPGLWVTVSMAQPTSKVFKEHPEWFVENKNHDLCNLHTENPGDGLTACLATDWIDYIKGVVLRLVREHGLAYSKLDFAIATSAYVYDQQRTGCWSGNHPYHKDHEESYGMIYERCMKLFDELHKEAPDLFIDCTYETAGKMQLMDYGIAKHAEGNWLSNIQQPGAKGAFRARLLAWQRCPALPASTLVIGNLRMDDEEYELSLKSLAGALPIMLGDPRALSAKDKKNYKQWTDWMKALESRHGYMSFRQDLPGFGEPAEGSWDGFARINTDTKSGGLVGVFRQGGAESERLVTVRYLDEKKNYVVREGKTGRELCVLSGKDLATKGFKVKLNKTYDGQLFEVALR